ncbi:MAG TPA: alpha/beta hydrolase [Actinomycetota bacterium]|nr:alpha/beta hydrolase [Actinomycetota bacterium]
MNNSIEIWRRRGQYVIVGGRRVFVWEMGDGPPLVAIHGFPGSSYDWAKLAPLLLRRRFIAFDLFGYGLSDKSWPAGYSLLDQADLVEGVLKELRVERCDLLAHDMGDSVASELLARANEGGLTFEIGRVVLLNGSVFIELAQLTSGQKLFLKLPARPLPVPPPVRLFRRQLKATFSESHRPDDNELAMAESLLAWGGGHRLLPVTIRYIEERRLRYVRWTSGLLDWRGPMTVIWGDRDPVAVPSIADRLLQLRPGTAAVRWGDVGHWPQLEVPHRVASELRRVLA